MYNVYVLSYNIFRPPFAINRSAFHGLIVLSIETLNFEPVAAEFMGDEQKQIYHEKQKLQFCLLHSLNNLFQEKDAFTRKDLDDIAEQLVKEDPYEGNRMPFSVIFKPHHNSLTGKRVVWHDRRNRASSINLDEPEGKLMGIVLNVPIRKYGGL
uniref:ubiquitinyl hydrolase 1 n=1 Tax=Lactuca sativa TaxID=4236 RepID=A0A9R1WTL7_LACSA|nr:hypothetical protein LSAT_V11C900497940 [Lactuca sativa]